MSYRRQRMFRMALDVPSRTRFDSLEPRVLLSTFAVTNTADSGGGSLRQAILNANASVGADTIIFSIGAGIRTIQPATNLPAITDTVTIDATTQPGYGGVNPFIQLRGDLITTFSTGLSVGANGCLIKGLNVGLFAVGVEIGGSNNAMESCYIGTDILGFGALTNQVGVEVSGSNNRIGVGSGQSASARNLISGNREANVRLFGPNNVITGNYIGTNFDGTATISAGGDGIFVQNTAGNIIGSPEANRRNVITGNFVGIFLYGADNTVVEANYIGVSPTGEALPGGDNRGGIQVFVGANIRIGGPGAGNVISGNRGSGISVLNDTAPANMLIESNFIGTNAAGTAAVPNGAVTGNGSGIICPYNGVTVRNNLLSGNAGYGVETFFNATITGNKIGTDISGSYAIPNGLGGFNRRVTGFDPNLRIGGASAVESNLISGNGGPGITVRGTGGTILGNKIGTNLAGTAAIANSGAGIYLTASNMTIGGTTAAERNLISGNTIGIQVTDTTATGNIIRANWIGLRADGVAALPNSLGIFIGNGAHDNEIGGASVAAGNVISGNATYGINVKPDSHHNRLYNNRIGTNAAGTGPVPNGSGIGVQISTVTIGDVGALGNTISGNTGSGIEFYGGTPLDPSLVKANRIGVALDGVTPLPNGGAGIRLDTGAGSVTINAGNVIQNNTGDGVTIVSNAGNNIEIFDNSIYNNGGLGIDLNDDGPTLNGPSPRPGPNGMTNFPDVVGVVTSGGRTIINGNYNGLPSTLYFLDFYSSPVGDATSYGEGATPIHTQSIVTDASGFASFTITLTTPVPLGRAVTATASRGANTSEFSKWNTAVDALGPRVTGSNFLFETAPLKLVVKFDEDVSASLSTSAFSVTRIGAAGTVPITAIAWDGSTFAATLTLASIPPDGNYRLTALASAIHDAPGNALDGNGDNISGDNYTYDFFVLAGDLNRDRTVNFDDLLTLSQHYGQTGHTFSGGNITYDAAGRVDFDDLLTLAQRYGVSVVLGTSEPTHKDRTSLDELA